MENNNKPVEFDEAVSTWEKQKPWKWYNWTWWWIRYGIWNHIKDLKWQIPNIYGRMRRGWGNADTWGFSDYLAKVICGGLKHLREIKHGYPSTLDSNTNNYDFNEKRWNSILDDMIYTFETAINITDRDLIYRPSGEWTEELYQKDLKFAEEMNEKFRDDITQYKVMTKEEVLRYEKGFDYFKEYFYNLWD